MNRRQFLKVSGVTAAAAGAVMAVKPQNAMALDLGKEHDDFPVKYDPDFKPFDQKNYVFMRIFWDTKTPIDPYVKETYGFESLQQFGLLFKATHDGMIPLPDTTRDTKGYTKVDKALELASWSVNAHFAYESELGLRNSPIQTYPIDQLTRQPVSTEPIYVPGMFSWDNSRAFEQQAKGLMNEFASPEEAAKYVKKACMHLGADIVGIAPYNERTKKWVYGKWSEPKLEKYPMPDGKSRYLPLNAMKFMNPAGPEFEVFGVDEVDSDIAREAGFEPKSIIVMAFEMDYDAMKSAPTLTSQTTVGKEYSKMAEVGHKVAQFIRELGYMAAPCGNDTAISVPLAIEAGIGEGSRMGMVVTEKYGPRVRLAKVFTNMEIKPDKPKTFGVKEFCNVCMKCADGCPGKAISTEPATILKDGMEFSTGKVTKSQMKGIEKWYVNSERCLAFWTYNGADCGTCIAVCPYNKIEEWHHQLAFLLTTTPAKPLLRSLDEWFGYGGPLEKEERFESKYLNDAVDDFWNNL